MKTVVLADNQEVTRFALKQILLQADSLTELVEVNDKKSLIAYLSDNSTALVLFDYTLFDFASVDELAIMQSRFKNTDWIIFSDELSNGFLSSLIFSTQNFSLLLKDCSLDEIKVCLREAGKGNRYICSKISNILLDGSKRTDIVAEPTKLTFTEQEILKEIALGKTTKEIAGNRFVSIHTIMTHRKNIFRKLEVNNVHEATKYAMRSGLIDMAEYYI